MKAFGALFDGAAQAEIRGSELMTPLADAVTLVHDDLADFTILSPVCG